MLPLIAAQSSSLGCCAAKKFRHKQGLSFTAYDFIYSVASLPLWPKDDRGSIINFKNLKTTDYGKDARIKSIKQCIRN